MAGRLEDMGVTRGTHVGIWSVNSPNWVFTFLALVKIGAVPVLINTCYRDEELKGILNYSDVEYVFCGAGCKDIVYDDVIADIRKDTPKVKRFLHLDEKEAGTWMSPDSFGRREKPPRGSGPCTGAEKPGTAGGRGLHDLYVRHHIPSKGDPAEP